MDITRDAGGRKQFVLGPVELWIVAAVAAAVLGGCAMIVQAYALRIDKLTDTATATNTRLEVMTAQLVALNALVADVPDLRNRVGRLEVIAENNRERIKTLEGVR